MKLLSPTLLDVLYVCHHLREWDRKELFAGRFDDDVDQLAIDVWQNRGPFCWVAGTDRAIAVVGAREIVPGGWSALMFATNDLPLIGKQLTRFVIRDMIPTIARHGMRWGECRSIVGHKDAHEWLRVLGAKPDPAPLKGYGKNGEDFIRFSWEASDVHGTR